MAHYPYPTCRHRGVDLPPANVECKSPLRTVGPAGVPLSWCMSCNVRDQGIVGPPVLPVPAAGQVRHLTYHLFPQGPEWRPNVAQLCERISLFNGRRLVAVAIGDGSAAIDEVRSAFGEADVELIAFPNDPRTRELVSHVHLVAALECYRGPGDVTFYGHGKGISTAGAHGGVRQWREAMYRGCLDYWPAVQRALRTAAAVGVYRRLDYPPSGTKAPWHFSGSFRWLRNADLYAREYLSIDAGWCGGEAYPARHFRFHESACLFGEFRGGELGLYLKGEWDGWAQKAADAWYQEHAGDRHFPQLVTVILNAHNQPVRVHEAIASVQNQTADAWQLLILHSGRCASPSCFERYRTDARIQLMPTGETDADSSARCGQGWAINEAWRRGRVRGDLVLHLSDDDVLDPRFLERVLAIAAGKPDQAAWYGPADRLRVRKDGSAQQLGRLGTVGIGRPSNQLRCRVDGMQVFHRRSVRTDWPEKVELRAHADGWWIDALASKTDVHPVPWLVGTHRHTPESSFTT